MSRREQYPLLATPVPVPTSGRWDRALQCALPKLHSRLTLRRSTPLGLRPEGLALGWSMLLGRLLLGGIMSTLLSRRNLGGSATSICHCFGGLVRAESRGRALAIGVILKKRRITVLPMPAVLSGRGSRA